MIEKALVLLLHAKLPIKVWSYDCRTVVYSVFLVYTSQHRGYLCLDKASGKIYTVRHVIFHENYFPYTKSRDHTSNESHTKNLTQLLFPPIQILNPSHYSSPSSSTPLSLFQLSPSNSQYIKIVSL